MELLRIYRSKVSLNKIKTLDYCRYFYNDNELGALSKVHCIIIFSPFLKLSDGLVMKQPCLSSP